MTRKSRYISYVQAAKKKPAETRDRIVELVGDVPRVELFARQKAEGWDTWGMKWRMIWSLWHKML